MTTEVPQNGAANPPAGPGTIVTTAAERLRILQQARTIAMVGLSANSMRPSHFVAIYMLAQGYRVIPVNPKETQILGQRCYASLRDIPEPVDIVDIFRDPAAVPPLVEDAIAIGAKVVWMQLGVVNEAAAQRACAAGLQVVMDRCVKIEHGRFFGGLRTLGLSTGVISSRPVPNGRRSPR